MATQSQTRCLRPGIPPQPCQKKGLDEELLAPGFAVLIKLLLSIFSEQRFEQCGGKQKEEYKAKPCPQRMEEKKRWLTKARVPGACFMGRQVR